MSYMKAMIAESEEIDNLSGCFDYEQQMHEEEHKAMTVDSQYAEWSDSYNNESINLQDGECNG